MLKNIVGLITPDLGDVLYDERSFIFGSEQDRKQIRREIGMLFQGSALFDSKNIEERCKISSRHPNRFSSRRKN